MTKPLLLCSLLLPTFAADVKIPPATAQIETNSLMRHVTTLASDRFEGRAPATPGEQLTIDYLLRAFRETGLQPGAADGSFIQKVPMVGIISQPTFSYRKGTEIKTVSIPDEAVLLSRRQTDRIEIPNSQIVFVGYGIVAPEYGWDDYKDIDVTGKTIIMLVNDPAIPDPKNPGQLDPAIFKGKAMTYYGRWTYKYEIATKKGAAAALIIHETGPAGYPYFVVIGSNSRENFDLQTADKNMGVVPVEGWLHYNTAETLARAAGYELADIKAKALQRSFKPIPFPLHASFSITNSIREVESQNVIAKIDGADPLLKNEAVIYSAHWDHLGSNPKLDGDTIYNGAIDNATGTAGLIEIAGAFQKLQPPPKRSIYFLATTAEEKGLLGAKYYTANPVVPLEKTVANLNMDSLTPHGRFKDINVVGYGNTTLETLLESAAAKMDMIVTPDAEPEKGRYFRSDHFEFARLGVPAIYLKAGLDYIGKPADFGLKTVTEYVAQHYHKVSDEIRPDWDLSGAVQELQLLFAVGAHVASSPERPEWKPGADFSRPAKQ